MRLKSTANRRRVIYFNMVSTVQTSKWYVYILECVDGSLYTGITKNVDRRLHEHNKTKRAAKYTRARRPVQIVASVVVNSMSSALKLERKVKKQKKKDKITFLLEYEKNVESI